MSKAGLAAKKGRTQPFQHHLKVLLFLLVLHFLLDQLYVVLYSTVNSVRATLIGLSALLVLWIPMVRTALRLHHLIGFIPIYASALLGVLAIQNGVVVSKSAASGALHALILIVTYFVLMGLYWCYWKYMVRK